MYIINNFFNKVTKLIVGFVLKRYLMKRDVRDEPSDQKNTKKYVVSNVINIRRRKKSEMNSIG